MLSKNLLVASRYLLPVLILAVAGGAASAQGNGPADGWGKPVDGLACRLVMQPRYVVGEVMAAVVEVKNTSDKKRLIVPEFDPRFKDSVSIEINGPKGKVRQTHFVSSRQVRENSYQPILPGEVKRFAVDDLRNYFDGFDDGQWYATGKHLPVPTGKCTVQLKFRSPKVPPRFFVGWSFDNGKKEAIYKDVPPELTAGQWAGEVASAPLEFELAPLGKDDLVVHEWGVFTVFNDVQFANVNRKEEWGSLPSFFYRQFPKERLRWVPAAWDKPLVYFYAKPKSMRVGVKVTFTAGAPVVWWPAVLSPVDDGGYRTTKDPKTPRPFRTLFWDAWLGDSVPAEFLKGKGKVAEFPLPADCWLNLARLPDATRLTVIGNIEGPSKGSFPGSRDRPETERFLFYDGLVPAPDYLRCEKIEATSVTLRNRAKFDIKYLFVVDRRVQGKPAFAFQDGKQPFKAGTTLKVEPKVMEQDWPGAGLRQVRLALLDAGLYAAEADSLLKIWRKRLLEAEGVTAFHILPAAEYERMLPLDVMPAPATKPVRVGIALHPHVEIEPNRVVRVTALIRQLNDERFAKRDAASKELLEIGPLAIALLRAELLQQPPLEMRRRIEAVLERVDAADWLQMKEAKKK